MCAIHLRATSRWPLPGWRSSQRAARACTALRGGPRSGLRQHGTDQSGHGPSLRAGRGPGFGRSPCAASKHITDRNAIPYEGWSRRFRYTTLEYARPSVLRPPGGEHGAVRRETDRRADAASAERGAGTAPHRGGLRALARIIARRALASHGYGISPSTGQRSDGASHNAREQP